MRAKVKKRSPYLPFTQDEWRELETNWSPVVYRWPNPKDENQDVIGLDTSRLNLLYNRRAFLRHELHIEE
jgi:hypothetical protein